MQTQFERFDQWISQKLEGVQVPYLVGTYEKLVALCIAIKEIHVRSFSMFFIIKEILMDGMPDIYGTEEK